MPASIRALELYPQGLPDTPTLIRDWQKIHCQFKGKDAEAKIMLNLLEMGGSSLAVTRQMAEDYAHFHNRANVLSHAAWAVLVALAERGVQDPTLGSSDEHLSQWRESALKSYHDRTLRAPQTPHTLTKREIDVIARKYAC